MPKKATVRGPLEVSRIRMPGLHFVGEVTGLALQVLPTGGRSWILRTVIGGRRRDMGLGGYPDVTLADARAAARIARDKIRNGIDPIAEAAAAKRALYQAEARQRALSDTTFEKVAVAYIADRRSGWKNSKHAAQWQSTLESYAFPIIGGMQPSRISASDVKAVLDPIWRTRSETASRVRGRIEKVLAWAYASDALKDEAVRVFPQGWLNPARWKGNLDAVLSRPAKLTKGHHAAVPYREIAAFMADLRAAGGLGARALEFAILTAARSGEVRGAQWSEIDLNERDWRIPADRMKMKEEHRVPLSPAAVALLVGLPRMGDSPFVFPAPRGGPLSDMTLSAVLKRLDRAETVHGFRSSFRTWASEQTAFPFDVAERALAHQVGNKTSRSYERTDQFEKRRRLMDDWARYCAAGAGARREVTPIRSGVS